MTAPDDFGSLNLKDKLKGLADYALPKLEALDDADMRTYLREAIKDEFFALQHEAENPQTGNIIAGLAAAVRDMGSATLESHIHQHTSEALTRTADDATRARNSMDALGVEGYSALINATISMLPQALRDIYDDVYLKGRTPQQMAQDYFALDAAELAQINAETFIRLPARDVAQAIHETAAKLTPDAATKALQHLTAQLDADDVADTALQGLGVVRDLLTVAATQDRIGFADAATAQNFCAKLGALFAAAAESFAKGGLAPDTDLRAAFDSAYKGFNPAAKGAPPVTPAKPKGPKGAM